MATETVTTERYVVRRAMHLGALRREIRVDDIIEWQPETERMKLNGMQVDDHLAGTSASEAMRQLRALSARDPDRPAIEMLEMASEQAEQAEGLATSTLCVLPILGCLKAAGGHMEEAKGLIAEISPVTEQQREFLEMFEDLMMAMGGIPELESRAHDDVQVINGWLKGRGFDIQLPDEGDPEGFAVASILDMLLKWLHEGRRTGITGATGEEFPGVRVDEGVTVSHLPAVHPHPVARVATKSGDTVCMSMVDEVPGGFAGLFLKVADLEKVKATSHMHKGVCFPMVDLDERPDITWIQGLRFGHDYYVKTAMQQTRFRMNEKGARAQSAAAMTIVRSCVRPRVQPHVIDRPFLLWIRRDGLEFPLFAALLCEDAWKEPKEL